MKTFLLNVKALFTFLSVIFFATATVAQPEYKFSSSTLESGTDLQIGAVYLFTNVKPGVDARVTIMNLTGGITVANFDGSGGFVDALQPILSVPRFSSGYLEMKFDFYATGTMNASVQTELPITPIDVDGQVYSGQNLYEYDLINIQSGYALFQMSGGELNVTFNSQWVMGKNKVAIDYPGIDTAQKSVMFTAVSGSVSTITVRVGAENNSNTNTSRLRSLYFKKFAYPSLGVLASNSLSGFTGTATENKVALNFTLSDPAKVKQVVVEKAGSDLKFQQVKVISIDEYETSYQLQDVCGYGTTFYRLKLIRYNNEADYSNILRFENTSKLDNTVKVFPTLVNDQFTLQMQNSTENAASLQLYDFNGRMVRNLQLKTQKGFQNITVSGLNDLNSGAYIVVVKSGNESFHQKIIVQ